MSSEWKLLASESQTLPRAKAIELATKHANLSPSPVERKLEPGRVKKLVWVIRHGLHIPFCWATVEWEGKRLRMNGQHSSTAIVEIGSELPDSLSFHVDHYEATSRGGMVELFRQFDQRWSGRTANDIAGAYQGLTPDLADCNRRAMKSAAEAVAWVLKNVEGLEGIPSGDDTYDLFSAERYWPFFRWFDGIYNHRPELLHKQVIAAMYHTYEASQSSATQFWREISFGQEHFTDDSKPGAVLIGELIRAREDRDFKEKEFETISAYYKKSIKAWNAFCNGDRISTLKVAKGKGWPVVSKPGEVESEAA
jgi:hypothetical protein